MEKNIVTVICKDHWDEMIIYKLHLDDKQLEELLDIYDKVCELYPEEDFYDGTEKCIDMMNCKWSVDPEKFNLYLQKYIDFYKTHIPEYGDDVIVPYNATITIDSIINGKLVSRLIY